MRTVWLVVMVAACGGGGGGNKQVDAKAELPADAAVDARATTGTALSHTLFVNTEGATVMPGADDATMGKSSIVNAMATLKPWRMGDAARATKIAGVITQFQTTLAPYGVSIVTARPAAGPYDMLIVTDDPPTVVTSAGVGAITPTSCNATASVISFVFPSILGASATDAAVRNDIVNTSISMFGIEAGIPASSVAMDCMCLAASTCGDPSQQPCTIGGPGTALDTTTLGGMDVCGGTATTMDENAKFLAAFGPH